MCISFSIKKDPLKSLSLRVGKPNDRIDWGSSSIFGLAAVAVNNALIDGLSNNATAYNDFGGGSVDII